MNYERFPFNVTMYVSLEISIIILWSLEMRLILTNTPRIKILSAHQMEPYIVGGAPIDLELCPSAVIIFNFGSMCAGSILNSYTVLTAAHCFEHNTDLDDITVHVGEYQFSFSFSIAAKNNYWGIKSSENSNDEQRHYAFRIIMNL